MSLSTKKYTIIKSLVLFIIVLFGQNSFPVFSAPANIEISYGNWNIVYDENTGTLTYRKDGKLILSGVFIQAKSNNDILESSDYKSLTLSDEDINDNFGSGKKYTISFSGVSGQPDLEQIFYFYNSKDYFLTEAYIQSTKTISSNYIAPVVTRTRSSFLPSSSSNRVLTIPFDNDDFIRYGSYPLTTDSVSFEVTAIFNGEQRNGMVIGSIEHTTWKTGIRFSTSDNQNIDYLACFGGITHRLTRDINNSTQKQHGSISGTSLKSPKIFVGYFDDWRRGLEQFGNANAIIAPPRSWDKGTPFGWNSWSGMETHVNYEGVIDVSDFIKNELKPKGFDNEVVVVGLDSWWDMNFTDQQLINFVKHCNNNGQEAGIYFTPFSEWAFDGERIVPGTNGRYRFKDIYLYSNETPIEIESRALDPTHPGTITYIEYQINRFKSWGYKYIKLDFINNGTLEADSFYESGITTGVQAYNFGMQKLVDVCGDDIFLALSIAPTFPAHYGHSKRISCDTWGQMSEHASHTGYMLNSLSFGWWLDRVYAFNDPDHLVLHDRESRNLYKEEENRSRITSGVITGLYMLGDNMSLKGTYQGTQEIRNRILQVASNEDINSIAKTGRSFYPVEGYTADEYDRSEKFFMLHHENQVYLAIFNFSNNTTLTGDIPLNRLGASADAVLGVKELWTGASLTLQNNRIEYSVPPQDVRVYRMDTNIEFETEPKIVEQPESSEVFVGNSVTFSVKATGGGLSYQWYKDDNLIENSNSNSLTINNVSLSNAGNYYCIVSNSAGLVKSNEAVLKVLTDEVKLRDVKINNVFWDIAEPFILCGTNSADIEITTEHPDATIIFNDEIVENKIIRQNIDRMGRTKIKFDIQSADNAEMKRSYEITIDRLFEFDDLIAVKWNNTLIANNNHTTNGGYKFKSYKWFKNNTLIGINPSYSAGPRRDMLLDEYALYYLEVTTTSDEVLRTCESTIPFSPQEQIKIYPNPVPTNGSVTVDIPQDDPQMKNAVIEVYTSSGMYIGRQRIKGQYTNVSLFRSPGMYIINVKATDFLESKKIIVR